MVSRKVLCGAPATGQPVERTLAPGGEERITPGFYLSLENDDMKKTGTLWRCENGPWKGHSLYLTSPITAWFTLHGVVGRYAYGKYVVQA